MPAPVAVHKTNYRPYTCVFIVFTKCHYYGHFFSLVEWWTRKYVILRVWSKILVAGAWKIYPCESAYCALANKELRHPLPLQQDPPITYTLKFLWYFCRCCFTTLYKEGRFWGLSIIPLQPRAFWRQSDTELMFQVKFMSMFWFSLPHFLTDPSCVFRRSGEVY